MEEYLPDCAVVGASSAREGLELARGQAFDAALIDVQMPEVDGLEMCRRLKAMGDGPGLAVLLITAKGSTPLVAGRGSGGGGGRFHLRPIDNHELLAKLRAALRRKEAERKPVAGPRRPRAAG